MNRYVLSLIVLVFLLGWAGNNVYSEVYKNLSSYSYKLNTGDSEYKANNIGDVIEVSSKEQDSPSDRVKESQIHVFDNSVVIEIDSPEWSTFTDTNSMDPIIDQGANAIHIVPDSEDSINVGDIVAYQSEYTEGIVIHRVIEIGQDEEGRYFILKGDNNPKSDPGKVRFEQIKRVLVAIIY